METRVTAAAVAAEKARKATNNLNQTYKPQELPVKQIVFNRQFFTQIRGGIS
jgi:hypothetical protein